MNKSKLIRKEPCPVCRSKGLDRSGDNLAIYADGGKYCWGPCNRAIELSDEYKAKINSDKFELKEYIYPVTNFTKEDWEEKKLILGKNATDPKGFRGLKKNTCDTYRVFHEYSTTTGEVIKQYYPISKDNQFSGIKWRAVPKAFGVDGTNNGECNLFGQALFEKSTSKWIVVASGELDALSAFQMLESQRKGDFASVPVVSGTIGEAGSANQYRNNYEFLNRFEKIILIPDQDEAGEKAIERVAQSLPKDKLYVVDLPAKDCNEMLIQGREKEFYSAVLFKHRHYSPAGIHGSDVIFDKILEKALTPKLPFPPFLERINDVTGGGMIEGSIINVLAGCYPPDTEFFTGKGWKKISEYKEGDLVLQYDKDTGNAFLDYPEKYVVLPTDQFYEIKNNRVSFITSTQHKHLIESEYGVVSSKTTLELLNTHIHQTRGNKSRLLNTFKYSGLGIDVTEEYIRLKVAVFADGSFRSDQPSSKVVRINIKKERKKERLRYLLKINNLEYKEKVKENGYSIFSFTMDNRDKHFPLDWYKCSKFQLEVIKDEVVYWDGSIVDRSNTGRKSAWSYTTLNKSDADFVQFVLTSLDYSCTLNSEYREKYKNSEKTGYNVRLNNSKGYGIAKDSSSKNTTTTIEKINNISDKMYCFTTKTGFFPVRQNNKIFVSGNSGSGKSTLVNQCVLHWIKEKFNPGIVSLEADLGDYGENILGAHVKQKLQLIQNPEDKFKVISEMREEADKLFKDENGKPSFYVIDERGDYENLQPKIEQLIITCESRIVIIDVLSDVFDGMPLEFQAKWMAWEKAICKRYGTIFVNVVHARKAGSGQKAASNGAVLSEEDMAGSSTQFKSGSLNIILSRDKNAEDENVKNIVQVNLSKNRWTGWTGVVGYLKYNMQTHTLSDATHEFEQLKVNKEEDLKSKPNWKEKSDLPLNQF